MKRGLLYLLCLTLFLTLAVGCGTGEGTATPSPTPAVTKIKVGASPTPHAELLELIKADLLAQGVEMEIVTYTDYVLPNMHLHQKDLDANFFQHLTYMKDFNANNNTNLVSLVNTHYEPLGLYGGKTKSLTDVADGATVAVPNDTSNEARALLLLEANGLIKLKAGVGILATRLDITENPKNLNIQEVQAAQLPRMLQDVDFAIINGNYALQANLKIADALAKEDENSAAVTDYANCVTVNQGDEERAELKILAEVLTSEKVRTFIESNYQGAVVPLFE